MDNIAGLFTKPENISNLYKRLIEFTGDAVYVYSFDEGKILFTNKGLPRILDLDSTPDELTGKCLKDLLLYTEKPGTVRDQVRDRGEIHNYVYHFKTLKGDEKWVLHDSFIVEDKETGEKFVEAVVKDITEQKTVEAELLKLKTNLEYEVNNKTQELINAYDKLRQAEKMAFVGKISGTVAHELRSPLSAIKNSVYILKMKLDLGKCDPLVTKYLNLLEREVDVSNNTISNILAYSRIKDPLFQKKNINDVIRETLNSLVRPENVNITWELNPDLPEVDIDEEQIRIVFRNLIINSFKAMIRTGDLRISTSKEDHIVRISFTDTGCGIEEERRKGIFDHLFTIEKDIKGFGLSISKLVIEKHKGSIGFESEIGKGTTFVIKLPVEQK